MTVIERYNADGLPIDTHVTIVDEARAAYQRQRAERDVEAREAAELDRIYEVVHTVNTIADVLGIVVPAEAVEVHGTEQESRGRVQIEGGLVLERAQGHYLRVIWACSACGMAKVPSPTFRDLAGLGWILEEGVRETDSGCTACFACERKRVSAVRAPVVRAPTAEEALLAAMAALIDARVGGGVVGELMTQHDLENGR